MHCVVGLLPRLPSKLRHEAYILSLPLLRLTASSAHFNTGAASSSAPGWTLTADDVHSPEYGWSVARRRHTQPDRRTACTFPWHMDIVAVLPWRELRSRLSPCNVLCDHSSR